MASGLKLLKGGERGRLSSITTWIAEALNDPDQVGPCYAMALAHMVGTTPKEIHTTKFGGKQWSPQELAEFFWNKVCNYCNDIPGQQTFNLFAFYGSENEPGASKPFLGPQKQDEYDEGLMTEGPNAKGALQQGMRLTEALIQGTFRQMSVAANATQQMLQFVLDQNMKLMAENRDCFAIMKQMMMDKALDNHNRIMEQEKYIRNTQERKQWLSFLPALANSILGRDVFPQSTADTSLLESIADSLTAEDFQKLASAMPPHLLGPLASRMADYMKKKAEEKTKIEQMVNSSMGSSLSPELNASGDD